MSDSGIWLPTNYEAVLALMRAAKIEMTPADDAFNDQTLAAVRDRLAEIGVDLDDERQVKALLVGAAVGAGTFVMGLEKDIPPHLLDFAVWGALGGLVGDR